MLADQALPDTDRLLAGVGRRRSRHAARRRAFALATTGVLVLGLLGFWRARSDGTRTAVGVAPRDAPAQPELGPKHAEAAPQPLLFTDGTRVVLMPRASADLRAVSAHGATIALEQGALDVDVVHTEESLWDVVAGGFDIHVTGTRFLATWDPQSKQLTVTMAQGTVRVSGPCVDEALAAPSTKVFACEDPSRPAPPAATASDAGTPSGPPSRAIPRVTETAATLLDVADTARLAGDAARAREIYDRVRVRFPRTAEAAKAAFLLGRMAEASGAADEALRSYAAAMNESPNGAFAQEALGRTMTLEQQRGNDERARELASAYLDKHPNGPYRAYATSVLDAHR